MARFLAAVALCAQIVTSQPSIDGGRGDLPGMKQDMFDMHKKQQKAGKMKLGKEPPPCPKSDKMSAFTSMALLNGEIFVRLDASDGPCHKLISIGLNQSESPPANFSVLKNASLTCGPVGEWKKRVAEEMSMVFFQGGLEWVKSENETIQVITEQCVDEVCTNHTTITQINEAKYEELLQCWSRSCDCEQAKNPKMKIILFTIFALALGGLGFDSFKCAWASLKGSKPSKHVLSKKEHRMVEVNFAYSHICDICRKTGTCYSSAVTSDNYDMCKLCYKAAKKKARAAWKLWLEKHPEDEDAKKGAKKDDSDDDAKKEDSQSDAGDKKDAKKESEAESDDKPDTEAEKDDTPATTGDEKAKSDDKSEEDDKDDKDVASS